ncbi:transcription initiation factor IIB [Kickxella alabastrina]|uniref:Transcription initiation factor IIB n=1 Tax=Kickxella alabastrina TaxID=61397 RepID=A0ACC1IPC3_9FUNG|nr:transcription initiation factor IIB [Kickxella alabastrina]
MATTTKLTTDYLITSSSTSNGSSLITPMPSLPPSPHHAASLTHAPNSAHLGARLLMTAATLTTQQDESSHSDSSTTSSTSTTKPPLMLRSRSRSSSSSSRAVIQRQERNLTRAFTEISLMCQTMDLPRSINEASRELYRLVEEGNLHRGKNIDALIATCIFLACRQKGVPRTFKEICALTRVPRKDIGRTFKYLKEKLGADAGSMSSDDLMARFCANLSLLEKAQECAVMLNKRAKERDTLAGKSPVSVAGACIYMASHLVGQPRDARVISHVAGVSEVTIKNSYKLLHKDRALLIGPEMLETDPMASLDNLPLP